MSISLHTKSEKSQREFTLLILFLAILLGAYARIYPVLEAGFPLMDGGMFYTMTNDLIQTGFHLPEVTTYNHIGIPFAYPPFAFYLTGFLQVITKLNLLDLVRWLPVFFSILTIPALYLFAKEILKSPFSAALATLIYALLPRSYEWIIMGGGISRSPATLFLILFAWTAYQTFSKQNWKYSYLTALFGGLILLIHPERALHAAATGLLFWLWLDRSRAGALRAAFIGVGSLLFSAPWWVGVLERYGIEPLILASHSAGPRWLFWAPFLQLNFTDETIQLVALLAIFGLFVWWKKGLKLIPVWFVLTFLVDPRSAPHVIPIQASILAAFSLSEIILPAVGGGNPGSADFLNKRIGKVVFGYLLIILLFNTQLNITYLNRYVLSNADNAAAGWIQKNTSDESRFLVVSLEDSAMMSPLLEWFPALSDRTNITTIQGREWLPGNSHYSSRMDSYPAIQKCISSDQTCLETWAVDNHDSFNYVYLSVKGSVSSRLSDALLKSPDYLLIYNKPQVLIFQRIE